MADVLKKVQRGQPLTIPANTFNAFVDAALDYQKRKLSQQSTGMRSERQHGIVLVRNDSGADRDRFDVLGVSGPVFDPATDPEAFKNYPAMTGVTPTEDDHLGKFVILLEPVPAGKLARAIATGVVTARVDVPDEDYPYRLADITDGSAANLTVAKIGSAAILWREGGIGVQWALFRLANLPEPTLFPVNLTQTGGSQGTTTMPASWTYSVIDPVTSETLATNVNPTVAPHKWKRPSAGWMIKATFGYAHYDQDGQLVLGWINEMVEQEACAS